MDQVFRRLGEYVGVDPWYLIAAVYIVVGISGLRNRKKWAELDPSLGSLANTLSWGCVMGVALILLRGCRVL